MVVPRSQVKTGSASGRTAGSLRDALPAKVALPSWTCLLRLLLLSSLYFWICHCVCPCFRVGRVPVFKQTTSVRCRVNLVAGLPRKPVQVERNLRQDLVQVAAYNVACMPVAVSRVLSTRRLLQDAGLLSFALKKLF